ncbi:sigma-70 family RNA polymerase sigma factor [Rosistilla oblonga]|uniref:sigma-70 family RNA polymerase sigma factor n=1 Tax=Rosistilla oblonga TaxID=2527990 RepID=UPI003A971DA6
MTDLKTLPNTRVEELIDRARVGCDTSLGELLDSYRDYLYKRTHVDMQTELRVKLSESDIVQDVMLLASREFGSFRGNKEGQLRVWLLRILHGRLIDGMRRFVFSEKRRLSREVAGGNASMLAAVDPGDSPSVRFSQHEEAARLLLAISELPRELQSVIRLRYLNGLTFSQIAEQLQVPVTTCRRRWFEAIELLQEELSQAVATRIGR